MVIFPISADRKKNPEPDGTPLLCGGLIRNGGDYDDDVEYMNDYSAECYKYNMTTRAWSISGR